MTPIIRSVSVHKTSDPRYRSQWQVTWRTEMGKQKKKAFATRAMALKYANLIRVRMAKKEMGEIIGLSWGELAAEFLRHAEARQMAAGSILQYRYTLERFGEIAGRPRTDRITIQTLDRFIAERARSATTINKDLRQLSAIFAWAVERGYMASNPATRVRRLKTAKKQPDILSPSQFQAILRVLSDPAGSGLSGKLCKAAPQWRCIILLNINGVARKNSLARMKVSDVNLKEGYAQVFDSKQKTYRFTPLHDRTIAELRSYIATLPDNQANLFTSKFSSGTWWRILDAAGVPRVKFHTGLRASLSTWLKQRGVAGEVVTAIFGHSSTQITYDHYTALDNLDAKRAAINLLPIGTESPVSEKEVSEVQPTGDR